MNNMKKIATTLALFGCTLSGSAMAFSSGYENPINGVPNSSWYVLPSINIMDPDSRFGTDHRGEGVGLRFGKPVSPSWDIQFGPTYSRSRAGSTRYQQNTLGVDGLYLFSRDAFRPFVLVGAGAEYDKANVPNSQVSRTSPYINAGLGFQYAFGDQWGMQADLRRAHSYLRGKQFNFDRANTNILTVGLSYAFDKPAPPVRMAQVTPPPAPVEMPPAPVASPPPPPPPRFERYTLSSTELFDFDSAKLRSPQPKLDEIADVLSRNAQINNVTITGYTDRLGSEKYNLKLSQRRAGAVKSYLTNKGIDAGRLTANGKGESNPVVECSNKKRVDLIQCLEPNRRVEVEQIVVERRMQ